ncbi:MAG: arylsulfatase [Candidatus Brocadiia bacterium]|nr:MAG: arylsulfatase [Candidatus Brocadiia bacterium]
MTKQFCTRRQFCKAVGFGLVSLGLSGCASLNQRRASDKPNFIIIFCDDMGYGDIGPFGANGYSTPNLDRMAAEGMVFTDFHVGSSVCSPSRAAIMTGCYPNRVGVPGNFHPGSKNGMNLDAVTIAQLVKQKGYATAMYGKWHLGHLPEYLPTSRGFDEWFGLPYSNDMWPYHPDKRYNFPDLPLMEGQKVLNPAVEPEDQQNLTTWFTDRTVKFINKNKDRPFLIYLPHAMPHVPLYVSDKYKDKTKRGVFGDVIEEIDWGVGKIMDALKKNGIDEDTLVIFTSDNGPWLLYGDHAGSADPRREGKMTSFEGGFRVPCVMRWPGRIPKGKRCDELASTIDLLPTIAALAQINPPEKIDGKDISPLMFGIPGAKSPHDVYYYFAGYNLQAIRSGKWKLVFPHKYSIPEPAGMGGQHGKYGLREIGLSLFDLSKDISETTDVKDKYPDMVKRLEELAVVARAELGKKPR